MMQERTKPFVLHTCACFFFLRLRGSALRGTGGGVFAGSSALQRARSGVSVLLLGGRVTVLKKSASVVAKDSAPHVHGLDVFPERVGFLKECL